MGTFEEEHGDSCPMEKPCKDVDNNPTHLADHDFILDVTCWDVLRSNCKLLHASHRHNSSSDTILVPDIFHLGTVSKLISLLSIPYNDKKIAEFCYGLFQQGETDNLLNLLAYLGCDSLFTELSQFILASTSFNDLSSGYIEVELSYFTSLFNLFSLSEQNYASNLAGPSLDVMANAYKSMNKFNILKITKNNVNSKYLYSYYYRIELYHWIESIKKTYLNYNY